MSLEGSISKKVPATVKMVLLKSPPEHQQVFVSEYKKRAKTSALYFVLAFFGIHLFFLGRVGLGILYIITWGGLGIWWLIELFYVFKRVREHNEDAASEIMRDIKIMDQQGSGSSSVSINNYNK